MFRLYHALHEDIEQATRGTPVRPAYLAALISLESHPAGNPDSRRFEPAVYRGLVDLRDSGRAWGGVQRSKIRSASDARLRALATSYGLTQIMGYHCLELGCSIEDLTAAQQLYWSVAYMRVHYEQELQRSNWERCFRMHNTGRPDGIPNRRDYVERGLTRMSYYEHWEERQGSLF